MKKFFAASGKQKICCFMLLISTFYFQNIVPSLTPVYFSVWLLCLFHIEYDCVVRFVIYWSEIVATDKIGIDDPVNFLHDFGRMTLAIMESHLKYYSLEKKLNYSFAKWEFAENQHFRDKRLLPTWEYTLYKFFFIRRCFCDINSEKVPILSLAIIQRYKIFVDKSFD